MAPKKMGKIILVIDDEDDIRHITSRMLQLEGYTVYQASDGETGLKLMEGTGAIDLVLLDLTLPGIDGWTVFIRMRHEPALWDIPVVIFSATSNAAWRKEALKMGASGYLVKPVSSVTLREVVASALK